jgi:hypothetical protein
VIECALLDGGGSGRSPRECASIDHNHAGVWAVTALSTRLVYASLQGYHVSDMLSGILK